MYVYDPHTIFFILLLLVH